MISYLNYKKLYKKYWILTTVSIFLFFTLTILDLSTGSNGVDLIEFFNLISNDSFIIYEIRVPRVISAILVGGSLALSSAILQILLRNPLASPFTLGISQASGFGASFAIIFLNALSFEYPLLTVSLFAFLSSILALSIILLLSIFAKLKSSVIILSGVAIGAFFSSLTMFLQYFADDMQVASTLFWTFGDLNKANFSDIYLILPIFFISFIYLFYNSTSYNALAFGEEVAKSLGVNIKILILISIILISLLSSIITAIFGVIGFVGLIAPHIVKILVGDDYRFVIALSTIIGANLILIADIISLSLFESITIPIGVITSLFGTPLFLYLLIKRAKWL